MDVSIYYNAHRNNGCIGSMEAVVMGREYEVLECGCFVSCDGGGGLIPCGKPESECKVNAYIKRHRNCDYCNKCLVCASHRDCGKD